MYMKKTTLALMTSMLLLGTWLSTTAIEAQDLHPSRRPSPTGIARTFVGDTYVKVVYSRPYKRGRDNIFGIWNAVRMQLPLSFVNICHSESNMPAATNELLFCLRAYL